MKTLHKIQQDFFTSIIDHNSSLKTSLFKVYHYNWRINLIKALTHTFPVTRKLTGDNFFQSMCYEYIKTNLSTYYTLNDYGIDFPQFVRNFPPAFSLPYLNDVAKLEWSIHRTLIEEQNQPINYEHLSHVLLNTPNPHDLIFRLPKTAYLISSPYPIFRIWETNQEDYKGNSDISLNEGETWLYLGREGLALKMDPLTQAEWDFLQPFRTGLSFDDFVNKCRKTNNPEALELFQQFLSKNYFVI